MQTAMTTLKLAAVTTLMLVAVLACGKKGEAGDRPGQTSVTSATISAKASCNMLAELGTCNEYGRGQAAGSLSFGLEKSLCEGFHGKFSNAGCGAEGEIGSCLMSDGEVKRYYGAKVAGDHALTLAEAKGDCESDIVKGKFTSAAAGEP